MAETTRSLAAIAVVAFLFCSAANAQTNRTFAAPLLDVRLRSQQKTLLPLGRSEAFIANSNPREIVRNMRAFDHIPFQDAGFSHLTLPFLYESATSNNTPEEAQAFAFLLSNTIDWSPGCYCARHAFFVFKRSDATILRAGRSFGRNGIMQLCDRWNAKYAIGGRLIREADGFRADIRIADQKGEQIWLRSYTNTCGFFRLLGKASGDIMRFLGDDPSPALIDYMSMDRCTNWQSIVDLGKAAFLDERSDEEFALYDAILQRDPGFADVRWWSSNQRYWMDGDRKKYDAQMRQALNDYLVESAFVDLSPRILSKGDWNADRERWLAKVTDMLGVDAPQVLGIRLRMTPPTADTMDILLRTLARQPNSSGLYYALWEILKSDAPLIGDADLMAATVLAHFDSLYLPGSSRSTEYQLRHLATAMCELGYPDSAAALIEPMVMDAFKENLKIPASSNRFSRSSQQYELAMKADPDLKLLVLALRQSGQYERAFNASTLLWRNKRAPYADDNMNAGLMAALSCRNDVLEKHLNDNLSSIAESLLVDILWKYTNVLSNPNQTGPVVPRRIRHVPPSNLIREMNIANAQMDLMTHSQSNRALVGNMLEACFFDRELWVLFDGYDRDLPATESAAFYDSIAWLRPNDPLVRQAIADFRKRTATNDLSSLVERARTALKDYEPIAWPALSPQCRPLIAVPPELKHDQFVDWPPRSAQDQKLIASAPDFLPPGMVACAIHQLVKKKEWDSALEMAKRYRHYAYVNYRGVPGVTDERAAQVFCNHLIHRVEAERKNDAVSPAVTPPKRNRSDPRILKPQLEHSSLQEMFRQREYDAARARSALAA